MIWMNTSPVTPMNASLNIAVLVPCYNEEATRLQPHDPKEVMKALAMVSPRLPPPSACRACLRPVCQGRGRHISFQIFNKISKEKFVEKYNYALSEINLREDKTLNSRILLNIPYGEKVFVLNETSDYFEVDNIIGNWVKVRYSDVEEQVFGGYLSVMPAPNRKHFSVDKIYSIKEYNLVYFRNKEN